MMSLKFCDCFDKIMSILGISNAKLAKTLNIDPSLVARWRKGTRIPPYHSTYVPSFIDYVKNLKISQLQKQEIREFLNALQFDNCGTTSLLDDLKQALTQCQICSIHLKYRKNAKLPDHTPADAVSCCNHSRRGLGNAVSDKTKPLKRNERFKSKALPLSSADKILIGCENILNTTLNILETIGNTPCIHKKPIFFSFNGDVDIFDYFPQHYERWKNAVFNSMVRGWKIILILRINNNVCRTLSFISRIKPFFISRNFEIYFFKSNQKNWICGELFLLSEIGIILGFPTQNTSMIDSALSLEHKEAIRLYYNFFEQSIQHAAPLFKKHKNLEGLLLQKSLLEFEQPLGNKYLFKNGISSLTIPLELYRKYLILSGKSPHEVKEYLNYHKKRLDTFYKQIRFCQFMDICTLDSLKNLSVAKQYPPDEHFLFENCTIEKEDMILHLRNIVDMVETLDNYCIAVVNQNQLKSTSQATWLVKEKSSVFMRTWDNINITESIHPHNIHDSEIYLSIQEGAIIRSFSKYFQQLWKNIPRQNKDKSQVIAWFKAQIQQLSEK